MRVLCATTSYPGHPTPWAGTFVQAGVRMLAERGHRVTLVHLRRSDTQVQDPFAVRTVAVGGRVTSRLWWAPEGLPDRLERSPSSLVGAAAGAVRLVAAVSREAREHDVVLTHWAVPTGLAGAVARRRHGVPHVCVLHSGGVHLLARVPFGAAVARTLARDTDAFAAVATSVAEAFARLLMGDLRRRVERRMHVIPNPVDAAPAPGTDRDARPTVAFLGRLVPVKGLDTLLAAVRPDDPFRVVVGGTGPAEEGLRRQAAHRRLPVEFVGAVAPGERFRFLGRASVVAHPSLVLANGRTEGLPTVAAEALRAGRPVVASRAGGSEEIVSDGSTGRLVPPGDADALRAALLDVLRWDPVPTESACRAAGARFDPAAVGARLESVLECAVSGTAS